MTPKAQTDGSGPLEDVGAKRRRRAATSRRPRLIGAGVCGLIGAATIVAAAVGTSGTRDVTDQLSYIATGGIVGLFFIGASATLLILDFMLGQEAATTQLSSEMAQVREFLRGDELNLADPPHSTWRVSSAPVSGPATSPDLVAIGGARRVHRADCALVANKPAARPITAAAAAEDGLEGCRVCEPVLSGPVQVGTS